jgi:AraC-like DNA-binding protein
MPSATGEMFPSRRIASTHDVDHAQRVLSDVFLPLDFPSARVRGALDLDLNALKVGGLTCGYMVIQQAVRIETVEAADYHLDIPTRSRATMRAALGPTIYGTRGTAGMFMPGRPVEIESGEQFAQISLMIPRGQLRLELANLLGADPPSPLEFRGEVDLGSPGARTLMQVLQLIDDASGQEAGLLAHPLATGRLEQLLLHSLLFAQPHNYTPALSAPSPSAGARPVARAVELLRSRPEHPWTVTELAAAVSLSVRSLQEGFRRSLDTTPMAYLRAVRLEKVHEELAAAEPGSPTVTEVAARWGFVHLGRFAAAYRRAYGERPSETGRAATSRMGRGSGA